MNDESLELVKKLSLIPNRKKAIDSLKGIDKTIFNFIIENKRMNYKELCVIIDELLVSKLSFKGIIVKNGLFKQKEITDIVLSLKPHELMDDEIIEMAVPISIIEKYKIMLCAITKNVVYLSTLSPSKKIVENVLKKYFEGKKFYFIPANINKIEKYIQKVKKITNKDNNLLEQIVRDAIRKRASDIHIEPESDFYMIKYRILGELIHQRAGNMDEYQKIITMVKARAGLDIAERRIDQDGQYTIEFDGKNVDLRVVCMPSSYKKENAVIRILDPDNVKNSLVDLGITELDLWKRAISLEKGLCLICGETGSGKTTTLNTTIQNLDRTTKKIVTIEDPVEYNIFNTSQITINESVGLTFSRAIRANLRADPDVIVIGEVREHDTASNMIKAAETGHLVFATLHTGTIRGAVNRLSYIGINVEDLKDILKCILVQTLMKVVCSSCHGVGCEECNGVGYTDRTVVSEIIYFESPEDVSKFLNSENIYWKTKEEDAYLKYKEGITTKEELDQKFGDAMTKIYKNNNEKNNNE